MISAREKKFVNALKQKKYRGEHQYFVVEGSKMLGELLQEDFKIRQVFAIGSWIEKHPEIDAVEISEKELKSISSLKTPNEVLAVVQQKENRLIDVSNTLSIALDEIQDPGNLGSIIRTADWFGIKNIVCSSNSVDVYNPKVIQATMGSFFRVNIVYQELTEFFTNNADLKVYGALLDGENIYQKEIDTKGLVLLMGNESKGISNELMPFITDKISIPKFGKAESLNVATATAILCSDCLRGGN